MVGLADARKRGWDDCCIDVHKNNCEPTKKPIVLLTLKQFYICRLECEAQSETDLHKITRGRAFRIFPLCPNTDLTYWNTPRIVPVHIKRPSTTFVVVPIAQVTAKGPKMLFTVGKTKSLTCSWGTVRWMKSFASSHRDHVILSQYQIQVTRPSTWQPMRLQVLAIDRP